MNTEVLFKCKGVPQPPGSIELRPFHLAAMCREQAIQRSLTSKRLEFLFRQDVPSKIVGRLRDWNEKSQAYNTLQALS